MNNFSEEQKRLHSYIRNKKKGKLAVGPIKDLNGTLIIDSGDMAELLLQTFAAIFVRTQSPDPALSQLNLGRMKDVVVSPSKVRDALSKLNGSFESGPDEVNPYMLKACEDQFVPVSL